MVSKNRIFRVSKGNNHETIKILGGTIKFSSDLEELESKNATDQAYVIIESTPFDIEINKNVTISKPRVKIEVPENSLNKENEYWNSFVKDSLDKENFAHTLQLTACQSQKILNTKSF